MNKDLFNRKISLFGAIANVQKAEEVLNTIAPQIETAGEAEIRIVIMNLIEKHDLKCSILYKGNTVWNRKKLIKDTKSLVKNGMEVMTDYLYQFLSLDCGSIAHYNKQGWIATYPTVDDLRRFFRRNEYGQSVVNHTPRWKTDAITITQEMEKILKV
jgi:hypothetical protein